MLARRLCTVCHGYFSGIECVCYCFCYEVHAYVPKGLHAYFRLVPCSVGSTWKLSKKHVVTNTLVFCIQRRTNRIATVLHFLHIVYTAGEWAACVFAQTHANQLQNAYVCARENWQDPIGYWRGRTPVWVCEFTGIARDVLFLFRLVVANRRLFRLKHMFRLKSKHFHIEFPIFARLFTIGWSDCAQKRLAHTSAESIRHPIAIRT